MSYLTISDYVTRTVTTYDESGTVTSTRPYTPDENAAADAAAAAQAQGVVAENLRADVSADEQKIRDAITALATLLGDNTTAGSLRQMRGTISNQYNAGVLRALVGLVITLAQQNRRVARQTLRLVRLTTGDFESADVGGDL